MNVRSVRYTCIIYIYIHIYMNAAHTFELLLCALYRCCKPTDRMEGAVRSVKV